MRTIPTSNKYYYNNNVTKLILSCSPSQLHLLCTLLLVFPGSSHLRSFSPLDSKNVRKKPRRLSPCNINNILYSGIVNTNLQCDFSVEPDLWERILCQFVAVNPVYWVDSRCICYWKVVRQVWSEACALPSSPFCCCDVLCILLCIRFMVNLLTYLIYECYMSTGLSIRAQSDT